MRSRFEVSGKTGPRQVVLTPRVRAALETLRKDQIERGHLRAEVFLDDQGRPVQNPRRAFLAAVERAEIGRPVRLHDLRRTALSNLAQANVAPVVIQRLSGHTSLRMTSHYLHADDDFMVQQVLEASRRADNDTGTSTEATAHGDGGPLGGPMPPQSWSLMPTRLPESLRA